MPHHDCQSVDRSYKEKNEMHNSIFVPHQSSHWYTKKKIRSRYGYFISFKMMYAAASIPSSNYCFLDGLVE